MSETEPLPKEPSSHLKQGWSPPRWLLQMLAKWWWLIGFECLGLLGVVLLYPLSKGFAGWWQNVQVQIAAVIDLPPTHPYVTALLVATLPLLARASFLAHRTLEHEEQQKPFEHIVQRLDALQTGLKTLSTQPPIAPEPSATAHRPPTRFLNVPPRNPYFTGRDELIQRLHAMLTTDQQAALTQTQAITGLGGLGKTQTALEHAYRFQLYYQTILWAQADTRETLISACLMLARLLELPEREAPEQTVILPAVQRWLATHSDWLLILDNVGDPALLGEVLPAQPQGRVLLTARDPVTGTRARALPLETLPPEGGALLLLRRAKRLTPEEGLEMASAELQAQARALSETLGGLPLALDQAGAYLEEHGCGVAEYQILFQTHRATLLSQRGQDATGHVEPVTVTVTLAFDKVAQTHPAAELLRLCAFLHPDAIPEELFTKWADKLPQRLYQAASDPVKWQATLGTLLQAALIKRQPDTNTLNIHRLVQAVLKDVLSQSRRRRWAERAVCLVNAAFPNPDFSNWERCQQLLLHALVCTSHIIEWHFGSPEAVLLLHQTGYYLYMRAQYTEALPLLEQTLALREQVLGPEHHAVAASLNNLALLYRARGQYLKALPLLQRALAINEKVYGSDHPEVATSLNNLAGTYQDLERFSEALPLYQRALKIVEQEPEPDQTKIATGLNNLAEIYQDLGRDEEALPLFQRALTMNEQELGPSHPNVASNLNNLAMICRKQGKFEEALPLYQRALAIDEEMYGSHHPEVATDLNNLALLYQAQEQYRQALPLLQRAHDIWEQRLGPKHPNVATCLESIAAVLRLMGQEEQAREVWARTQAILADQHLPHDQL
jgi:tetratricopeptide (TPR) repeat protein